MPKSLPNRIRFTDLALSRLKEPGLVWDALLPRFGCRVSPTSKVWIITIGSSKKRFGRFPELGVAEARAKAREILADPGALEAHQQATAESGPPDTFGTLAAAFLAHGRTKRGRPLRPNTVKEYRRALLTYASGMHDRPVPDIRRADVAAVIRATASAAGATSAMRTRAALSRFWSWAVANGHVDANVVTGTEGYAGERRKRVLTDGELSALWAETGDGADFGMIIRLCLWTGCRRSEAGSMAWSELVDGTWTVPDSRTKNGRPLVLPLPSQAVAALSQWPRVLGKDTLFGRGDNGFTGWSKAKARLDARLGFAHGWDLHDIRRSVQTRMLALGISRDVVSRILNHAMTPIDETYDLHTYLHEKADALQFWADNLDKIASATLSVIKIAERN